MWNQYIKFNLGIPLIIQSETIIMSNNEPSPIQNHIEPEPPQEPLPPSADDQYEQLLQEGKQVIDSIPVDHGIQDDVFHIQRKGDSRAVAPNKNHMDVEGPERKENQSREGEPIGSADSKAQADNQSKNEMQNNPSMAKKASRVFVGCNCIKSKCTKNYCECFTQARKCSDICKCTGCENQGQSQKKYRTSFEAEETERICNCKKSNCLKKYCQCFNSGVKCNSACKCEECKNGLDDLVDAEEYGEEGKEEAKKAKSPEELQEINAKIDEIARLVPKDQQEFVLSFLQYWLS